MHCVLVVDDDQAILLLAREVLEQLRRDVIVASCGVSALCKLAKYHESIDLVLLDVKLPGDISGPRCLREMLEQRPDLPIIAMSGCPNGDVTEMMEQGAVGFIQKPFSLRQLETSIASILGSA